MPFLLPKPEFSHQIINVLNFGLAKWFWCSKTSIEKRHLWSNRAEYLTIINTFKLPGTTIFSAIVSRLVYKFFLLCWRIHWPHFSVMSSEPGYKTITWFCLAKLVKLVEICVFNWFTYLCGGDLASGWRSSQKTGVWHPSEIRRR